MELDESNGVAGSIPEFGAIFMSNTATKRECLKYKVFGLPASEAKFVKQVKAGMILFLFEHKRRELFGVYQACSDGAMDIVPHLCKKLGMKFPAQVQFIPIWHCNPLSEREFREAIYDNYFTPKKFNFGLSKDQVHRLLQLFSSRKLKNKLLRQPSRAVGEERRMIDDDRGVLVKRADMRSCEGDAHDPGKGYDYPGNSLNRSKESEDDILQDDCGDLGSFPRGGRVDPFGNLDDGEKLMMRNRTVGRFDTEAGFGSAYPTEHCGKSLNWRRLGITGDRYSISDTDEKEYNNHHRNVEPLVSNIPTLDKRLVNRHGMVSCPVTESECFGSHLHNIKKTTGDGWLVMNERLGGERNFCANLGPGSSIEKFGNPLNSGYRNVNHEIISTSEGRVTENLVDSVRCSTTFENPRYVTSLGGRVFNNSSFRNDNQVKMEEGIDTFARPDMTEYIPLAEMTQNSHDYLNSAYSTCADATAERVIPYIPELTRSPHYSLSQSGSPAYGAKDLSRKLDVSSAYGNNGVSPTISDYPSQQLHGTSRYSLSEALSSHTDLESSAYLGHRIDSFDREKRSASHALNRMEKPTFGKDGNYLSMSERMFRDVTYPDIDKTSVQQDSHKQDLSSGMYHREKESLNYNNEDFKSLKDNTTEDFKSFKDNTTNYEGHHRDSNAPSKDSNSNRESVFSRLTTAPVGHTQGQQEENNNCVYYDESCMDSSVNELMDLLQRKFKNRVKEGKTLKKSNKRFHSGCGFGEKGVDERQASVESRIEIDQSTISREMEDECKAIDENSNEVPKETRTVDFKRRSETKRKLIQSNTKIDPSIAEGTTSIFSMNAEVDNEVDKSCKRRRKLVRPVFAKNDSVDEGVVGNPVGNSVAMPNLHQSNILNPVFAKNDSVEEGVVSNSVDKSDTIINLQEAEIHNPVSAKNDLVDEGGVGNPVDKSDTIPNVQEAEILNPVFGKNDSVNEGVFGNPVENSDTIPNVQGAEILNPDTCVGQ